MKHIFNVILIGLLLCGAACSSVKPLKMAYYRKNIVVKADGTLWANEKKVNMDTLRSDLVAQMIFEDTPIMIHFHNDLTRDDFDRILGKLKENGFKNCRCTVYRD